MIILLSGWNTDVDDLLGCPLARNKRQVNPVAVTVEAIDYVHAPSKHRRPFLLNTGTRSSLKAKYSGSNPPL